MTEISARVVPTAVMATISTVFPGFLIGALSVQVGDELQVSDARYGWLLGGFFLAAAAGSRVTGALVQRIGPRRQMSAALAATAVVQLLIATTIDSFNGLVILLGCAGFANAANQTAVNLALTRAKLPRLGLAIAIKQSGMPTASMLAGFSVPAIALTVGWRWAYVGGALVACGSLLMVRREIKPFEVTDRRGSVVVSSRRSLLIATVSGFFLAFCAGALNAWTVESGVDAGLGEGTAGLMLSLGAASGIALRLIAGTRVDTMNIRPFRVAGLTVLVGAVGMAMLSNRSGGIHVGATVVAFAGGWIWPVFSNFGIMRTNKEAAGAASGVTQTGVFVGVFVAPVLTGWLIDTWGFSTMWLVVAASAVLGAIAALVVADEF